MQNDILPPESLRRSTKINPHKPMRSMRLQGHTNNNALNRLKHEEKRAVSHSHKSNDHSDHSDVHAQEIASVISRNKPKSRVRHFLSKRSKIEIVILSLILISGISAIAYLMFHKEKPETPVVYNPGVQVKAAPKKTTVASPLSGVEVTPALAARPVTGIMIENSPDARPQSGLQDAGVVYEAIAEGGITRFMALFQDTRPLYIGPVRSLRPYYIDFAAPYQASVAHVGGSPDALAQIRSGGYRDIDQFFNSGFYSRINTRYAPHNVYTDFNRLDQLNKSKGYTSSKYTPWKRKADKAESPSTVNHIDVQISSDLYFSHYDYDKASNSYFRSEGGRPHMQINGADDRKGTQIHPKTVIALVMSYGIYDRAGHSSYGTSGSGEMLLFQDGGLTRGKWHKTDRGTMFNFVDSNGKDVSLNAGQTWITIVKSPGEVIISK